MTRQSTLAGIIWLCPAFFAAGALLGGGLPFALFGVFMMGVLYWGLRREKSRTKSLENFALRRGVAFHPDLSGCPESCWAWTARSRLLGSSIVPTQTVFGNIITGSADGKQWTVLDYTMTGGGGDLAEYRMPLVAVATRLPPFVLIRRNILRRIPIDDHFRPLKGPDFPRFFKRYSLYGGAGVYPGLFSEPVIRYFEQRAALFGSRVMLCLESTGDCLFLFYDFCEQNAAGMERTLVELLEISRLFDASSGSPGQQAAACASARPGPAASSRRPDLSRRRQVAPSG